MRLFKWGSAFLIVCCLIGLGIWVFLPGSSFLSSTEKTNALRQLLGRDPHIQPVVKSTGWTLHKSNAIKFSYPTDVKIYVDDDKKAMQDKGVVDSFSFSVLEDHMYATVQVKLFPDSLSEYPAVSLRMSQPTVYTQVASTSASVLYEFTKDTDMVEHSGFSQKNGKVVSVAITGYSRQKVDDLYNDITSSLQIF